MLHRAVTEGNGYSAKVGSALSIYREEAAVQDTQSGSSDGKSLGNLNIVIRLRASVLPKVHPETPTRPILNNVPGSFLPDNAA